MLQYAAELIQVVDPSADWTPSTSNEAVRINSEVGDDEKARIPQLLLKDIKMFMNKVAL